MYVCVYNVATRPGCDGALRKVLGDDRERSERPINRARVYADVLYVYAFRVYRYNDRAPVSGRDGFAGGERAENYARRSAKEEKTIKIIITNKYKKIGRGGGGGVNGRTGTSRRRWPDRAR